MQAYTLLMFCAVLATAYGSGQVLKPRGSVDGGVGGVKKPDAEVKAAVNAVSKELAKKAKSDANTDFVPIEYLTQTVAGTNYFVKIRVGKTRYVLARILQKLDGKYRLDGFKNIRGSDPAAYMDGNIDH